MAKDKKYTGPGTDLGTIKEVHCSGVSVTTTGAKVFIANVAKGDRIIEVDGKKQIAPKAIQEANPANKDKTKDNLEDTIPPNLNSGAGDDGDGEE